MFKGFNPNTSKPNINRGSSAAISNTATNLGQDIPVEIG